MSKHIFICGPSACAVVYKDEHVEPVITALCAQTGDDSYDYTATEINDETIVVRLVKPSEYARGLAYELEGALSDYERIGTFDQICVETVRRVRDALFSANDCYLV